MRTLEKNVYRFSELSDSAKENAREWYRGLMDSSDYAEFVIEDAMQVAAILGIEIATRPVKIMDGSTRQDPCIYWSGFSSQGDGACFEGWYSYAKGSCKKIREYAPQDTELHYIADHLASWQRVKFYRLQAKMQHRGHYYHSGCMSVNLKDCSDSAESAVTDLMRDFADWIYRQL